MTASFAPQVPDPCPPGVADVDAPSVVTGDRAVKAFAGALVETLG